MVNAVPHRSALVTGGAARVGGAISRDLAANGWAVAIHYNTSREPAETLAREVTATGGRAVAVGADLAEADAVAGLLQQAEDALGPVNLLVNNAATFLRDDVGRLDRRTWDTQMAVNLAAPVFLTEALAARLPSGAEGNVVNILDQRVLKPIPVYVSYQLAKSALHTATRTLAQALAPRVRVNGIAPGPTLPHARSNDEEFSHETRHVPLKRGADLAEFGRTVRFLVENRSITGQTLALDGGQHLAWETADHAVLS